MIGTIRPSRNALDCLGLRNEITSAMCRTCNAAGRWFGQSARLGLSHDTIFLGLFSRSQQFLSAPLRSRPLRCLSNHAGLTCPDARYLAATTVFMSVAKLTDAIADGELSVRDRVIRKIRSLNNLARSELQRLGLPIQSIETQLCEYQRVEQRSTKMPFTSIARPIANAYAGLFEHLPSSTEHPSHPAALRDIGSRYGQITLLVDAFEDAENGNKAGRFNAWQASCDLPHDQTAARANILRRFEALILCTDSECRRAGDYLRAARNATMERLEHLTQRRGRLLSHPAAAVLAGINCCQQDCAGNTSMTPTGMCIAVLCCAACLGCCCCSK